MCRWNLRNEEVEVYGSFNLELYPKKVNENSKYHDASRQVYQTVAFGPNGVKVTDSGSENEEYFVSTKSYDFYACSLHVYI